MDGQVVGPVYHGALAQSGIPTGGLVAAWDFTTRNLLKWSDDFSKSAWSIEVAGGATVTVGTADTLAPDGTQTATKVIATGSGNVYHGFWQTVPSAQTGVPYRVSLSVKAGTGRWVYFGSSRNPAWYRFWVDLQSGTIGTAENVSGATITPQGNGWYRLSVAATLPNQVDLSLFLASGNGASTYVQAGETVYVANAQLELGPTATTYQRTTDFQSRPGAWGTSIAAQLGSAAGADTNDPVVSTSGLTFATDDRVDAAGVNTPTSALTYMVVAKSTNLGSQVLIGGAGGNGAATLKLLSSYLLLGAQNIGDAGLATNTNWLDGAFHTGAATLSGTAVKYYRDGVPDGTTTLSQALQARPIRMGDGPFGSIQLNGTLAFGFVWNRELTDAEIAQVHRVLKARGAAYGVVLP
jgi:hypothetical protein